MREKALVSGFEPFQTFEGIIIHHVRRFNVQLILGRGILCSWGTCRPAGRSPPPPPPQNSSSDPIIVWGRRLDLVQSFPFVIATRNFFLLPLRNKLELIINRVRRLVTMVKYPMWYQTRVQRRVEHRAPVSFIVHNTEALDGPTYLASLQDDLLLLLLLLLL